MNFWKGNRQFLSLKSHQLLFYKSKAFHIIDNFTGDAVMYASLMETNTFTMIQRLGVIPLVGTISNNGLRLCVLES